MTVIPGNDLTISTGPLTGNNFQFVYHRTIGSASTPLPSISSSNVAVPEPSGVALGGLGLAVAGMMRRKRKK